MSGKPVSNQGCWFPGEGWLGGGTQRGGLSPSGGTWSKEVIQMHEWLVGNEEFNQLAV